MKKPHILLCDTDAMYLGRLHGYLQERIQLPVTISDYTDPRYLADARLQADGNVLIVAEEAAPFVNLDVFTAVLLLTETLSQETAQPETEEENGARRLHTVCRYQKASDIADKLLQILSGFADAWALPQKGDGAGTRLIGYYSPLRRCMQTSMAIATGQLLSDRGRTMYLNFDPYASPQLTSKEDAGNLADLVYYYGCAREKLPVWIERMKKDCNGLQYVPPATGYLQTADATAKDWIGLLQAICETSKPDYLLLDLSECVSGLFEILSLCDVIYTITGHDGRDKEKIAAYRRWLSLAEEEAVMQKTVFCALPKGCALPQTFEGLSESKLAKHILRQGLTPDAKGL